MLLPRPALAQRCGARNWQYSVADLQEARRRLKSEAIQTLNARVTCAETIIATPGLRGPFPVCEECAVEYAGLLADGASFMENAAEDAAGSDAIRRSYIAKEVAVRQRLHDFLIEDEQATVRDDYFSRNLRALAAAMERAGMARQYHQLLTELDESSGLHRQVYRVWVKAVRSCAVWDFRSVDNLASLRGSLCNDDCIEDLRAVYVGLQAADLVGPDGKVRRSMPPLPIPAECEPLEN
jgi:hypothetical protein